MKLILIINIGSVFLAARERNAKLGTNEGEGGARLKDKKTVFIEM